jgi:hypothetical protein
MIVRREIICCFVVLSTLACVVSIAGVAEACPNCKEALAQNDSDHMRVARGYFWSILFMMSMPFAIVGSFGTYVYVQSRKARASIADSSQIATCSDVQSQSK